MGKICDLEEKGEEMLSLVACVFGFQSGKTLEPFGGLNEFLSAVMAVRALKVSLSKPILLQIVACIEATIPFRKMDSEGCNPFDRLFVRLVEANELFDVGMDMETLDSTTKRAVDLAHRDVANFQAIEIAEFVDNTWKLLPESNIPLQKKNPYLLSEFHKALRGTHGFLSSLDIDSIFYSYEGFPKNDCINSMRNRARYNVTTTCKYAEVKLLAIGIIEAIATLTGGDGPLCLFLGDLPSPNNQTPSFEDALPPIPEKMTMRGSDDVFRLLWHGRSAETCFDIRNSPVGAYIYHTIGDAGVDRAIRHLECPMSEENSLLLLREIPQQVLKHIIDACAYFAHTRRKRIQILRQRILSWNDIDENEDHDATSPQSK